MEEIVLKNSVSNHLKAMGPGFLILITIIGMVFWFNFDPVMTNIMLIFFCLFILPGIYLHIEYWYYNKNTSFILSKNEIIRTKNNKRDIYKLRDIRSVVVYGSATLFKPWFHLSAMEQYHFARIKCEDGEEFIITCLLASRVDNTLEKYIKVKRKKGLFNSVLLNTKSSSSTWW